MWKYAVQLAEHKDIIRESESMEVIKCNRIEFWGGNLFERAYKTENKS